MEISFSKIKYMVRECEEARFGKYVDLELFLDQLSENSEEMDSEEALLRFIFELTKIY